MQEERDLTVPGWKAIGKSVRGATHVRSGLPNQDALQLPREKGEQSKLILAIADGHGSNRYFRSAIGAQQAVAAAYAVMESILEETNLSLIKRWAADQLPKQLISSWREMIKKYHAEHPFTHDEQKRLIEKDGRAAWDSVMADSLMVYGATILAVLVTEVFILYVQLGDGDILAVSTEGEVSRPLPPDERLIANETTSLCSRNAWADFRIYFEVLSHSSMIPALIMLSTDGYANSYRNEKDFLKVGSDFLELIRSDGLEEIKANLEGWLTDATQHGSGDDITLGLLCRADAIRQILVVSKQKGQFATITEAIKHAQPHARIFVKPGVYNESCTIQEFIEIIGDGPVEDIIIESVEVPCISMQTEQAKVRGLTLRKRARSAHSNAPSNAVDISMGRLLLEDCDIKADMSTCIAILGASASAFIRRCKIHDGGGSGILIAGAQGRIEDCAIYRNTTAEIEIRQKSTFVIHNCKILDGKGCGVSVLEGSQGQIEDCDISGHTLPGIVIGNASDPSILRCNIHAGQHCGVYIFDNGRGKLEDCDVFENAPAGIAIMQGSKPVIRGCKVHDSAGRGILIWGQGVGEIKNCEVYENIHAGVEVRQESHLTISSSKIYGGKICGIHILEQSQGDIESCDIYENAYAGIVLDQASNVVVHDCTIHHERGDGILARGESTGKIEHNEIYKNELAGVEIGERSFFAIHACFLHNNAGTAISFYRGGQGDIQDCRFEDNTAGKIGGDMSALFHMMRAFLNNLRVRLSGGNLLGSGRQVRPRSSDKADK